MALEAGWALQQAIHGALAGDAGVTGLLGGAKIFDDVPAGTAFPYVTVGQLLTSDAGTQTDDAREHALVLHAWSRQGGRREAAAILAAIEAALGAGPIAIQDHGLASLRYEGSEVRRDSDGETFHGVLRLRALTEPAP